MKRIVLKLTLSAMFLAMAFFLPFLTGQIPQIGSMLLPMHLPVLLCGIICGPAWGAAVGFVCPVLRSMVFTMPPMAVAMEMSFELLAYGAVIGLCYALFNKIFKNNIISVFASLFVALIAGRLVWAAAAMVLRGMAGSALTWDIFVASAFVNAIPGIVLQFVLVPSIIILLERTKVLSYQESKSL